MDDLTTFEPVSASADGARNMYSLQCDATGQRMNYAACQWRQGVLAKPDIKTPADWNKCAESARHGTCPALLLRKEEELAGKAIYFDDRNIFRKATDAAKRWVSNVTSLPSGITKRDPAVVARHTGGSMLDALGDTGSLADAITAAASEPAAPVARVIPIAPAPVALAGESPLQMARRIAAERSTSAL